MDAHVNQYEAELAGRRRAKENTHEPNLIQISRRLSDVLIASIVLVFAAPLLVLIAVVIRIDSPGPALFKQIRMTRDRRVKRIERRSDHVQRTGNRKRRSGKDRRKRHMCGRPFRFIKFRTMRCDASEAYPELYQYESSGVALQDSKVKNSDLKDPRVTRFGAWLRRTSLDELPNFWNVLMGDMTIIGPRPEVPEMSCFYDHHKCKKFSVKPGITGLAQINGRGHLNFRETVAQDLQYVRKRSIFLDFRILWATVIEVVKGRGAF